MGRGAGQTDHVVASRSSGHSTELTELYEKMVENADNDLETAKARYDSAVAALQEMEATSERLAPDAAERWLLLKQGMVQKAFEEVGRANARLVVARETLQAHQETAAAA